jgi:glucokinase
LKILATGGIYVAGGVAVHTVSLMQEPEFMHAFANKGRFSELMKLIPIHVIIENAALAGAATYALERL